MSLSCVVGYKGIRFESEFGEGAQDLGARVRGPSLMVGGLGSTGKGNACGLGVRNPAF